MKWIDIIGRAWNAMWFQHYHTAPLEIVRISLASLLLITYGLTSHDDLALLYSGQGFFSHDAAKNFYYLPVTSVFFFLSDAWQVQLAHYIFIASFAALTLGWHTRIVKWVALIGHLSYLHANPLSIYGVDSIIAAILLPLCFAPVGACLSLDQVRRRHRALVQGGLEAQLKPVTSPWGFACTRMIQIQLVVLYLYSSVSKLKGESWLNGDALWYSLFDIEISWIFLPMFAEHYWLVKALTYGTLVIELAYVPLVWFSATLPYVLIGVVCLHLGIAVFMAMPFFGLVMIAGNLAFFRHSWFTRIGDYWRSKTGDMLMVYDGKCDFCVRSMAWLLAFDGMHQINTKDLHQYTSPLFTQAEAARELVLVTGDNEVLAGFDAYRHVVLRVPGLWWLAPAFLIPWLSRRCGQIVYRWVARSRSRL
jgi:predicted DCC family thiol-disulfide oxidoreductase YuxK